MKRAGLILFLALGMTTCAFAAAPPTVASARQLLEMNVARGDYLKGQPANASLATRMEQMATDGLAEARALVAANPKSPEAHAVLGLFLTVAYRSLPGKDPNAVPQGRGSTNPAEVKEGLEALRTARLSASRRVRHSS